MKKKTLFNIKGAGRPAQHDRGIRHIARDEFNKLTVLHLTVKVDREKSGLKNKLTLKVLWNAIKKARMKGLRIIHYTLEFDHVHLLVEADNKAILGTGMQSFGITLSKGINKLRGLKGQVFKTRYHFRKLRTPTEVKNVVHYILGNSIKHKSSTFINQYNSLLALKNFSKLYPGFELKLQEVIVGSDWLYNFRKNLEQILSKPQNFHIKLFC